MILEHYTVVLHYKGGQPNCPVDGKCKTEGVIYEATVTEVISRKKETYTGLTTRRIKDR